jgi:hypothetical protein
MRILIISLAFWLSTFGCASSGQTDAARVVPVFLYERDVPCEYVVLQPVQAFARVSAPQYKRMRARRLGEAGARVGADAVLIPDSQDEPMRGDVGVAVEVVGGIPQPIDAEFSGLAIRFLQGTCRDTIA